MKTSYTFFKVVVATLIVFLPSMAIPFSAIESQQDIIAADMHKNTADVSFSIDIDLPDYPKVEPITFEGHERIPYTAGKSSVSIDASGIKPVYAELKDIPESMQPMTIELKLNDRTIRAAWNEQKDVSISDIDVEVSIYKKRKYEIRSGSKPLLQFTLSNIDIFVDDLNLSNNTIILGFNEALPSTDNELFNEFLSGKEIVGTIVLEFEKL